MAYASEGSQSRGMSPYTAGALGAAGGAGAALALERFNRTESRSRWALGLGAFGALQPALNYSALQSDQTNALNLAAQANALAFTTGAGVTGEQVAALRAIIVNGLNSQAVQAGHANPMANILNSDPTTTPGTTGIGASSVTTPVVQQNSNTGLFVAVVAAALIGVAVLKD